MLDRIRIRDLGVIDDAEVDLAPGLNVLTGETGAGKTMVVSGLNLLLGARGDAAVVRTNATTAWIEGIINIDATHPIRDRIRDAGGDADDDIIIARAITNAGRSRAHAGGRSVPVGMLAEIGHKLVAVHGQTDQWRLKKTDQHREMLDAIGGPKLAAAHAEYTHWYQRLTELHTELERVRELERNRHLETQMLLTGLEEIEHTDPQPGEDEKLREEDERLTHAEELRRSAATAHAALAGDDINDTGSIETTLAHARNELATAAIHDPALREFENRTAELGYLAAELATDLSAYLTDLDIDPARLEHVQQRRAELNRLTRTYGQTIDDVLTWAKNAAARLAELEGAQARLSEIETETTHARAQAAQAARTLHEIRLATAATLSTEATNELAHLSMGKATLTVDIHTTPDPHGLDLGEEHPTPLAYTLHGVDTVEIKLAPNPGAPARSVAKAASGGELSRVMLALEVVTGRRAAEDNTAIATFVFDEVDAGIGGRAALDVGARLAALAEHAQVIVVTHLAQVAAFADRHLVVRKSDDGAITSSGVEIVTGDNQLRELARMMAGTDSPTALQHAAELRTQTENIRQQHSA
ncbi:Recombination protein N [Dermatophilus congolensis]|uniref:DNA repair protein RecN n=1 Tax=Dermatophilus congolensis TaxID=1863 RepID=A0A239VHC9_9MICO|nr:DNA repair protein RecN [Dermatophilus congolensis]SNV21370.1 Recombination protein N [Dermatophilus congolensis]